MSGAAASIGVVVIGVVVVVGSGCPSPTVGCGPREFSVDADVCGVAKDCVVDFGAIPFGLSETRRVSWTGACNEQQIFEPPHLEDDDGGAFAVGDNRLQLGSNFDEGFVFVSATPRDDGAHSAILSFEPLGDFEGTEIDGVPAGDDDFIELFVNR